MLRLFEGSLAGLPMWAWGLILAGGIAAAFLLPKLRKSTTSSSLGSGQTTPTDPNIDPNTGVPYAIESAINPSTGLPAYYGSGFTSNPGAGASGGTATTPNTTVGSSGASASGSSGGSAGTGSGVSIPRPPTYNPTPNGGVGATLGSLGASTLSSPASTASEPPFVVNVKLPGHMAVTQQRLVAAGTV